MDVIERQTVPLDAGWARCAALFAGERAEIAGGGG